MPGIGSSGTAPGRWSRSHLPRRTVRLRLTLMYGALFVVAGAALLGITYGLFAGGVVGEVSAQVHGSTPIPLLGLGATGSLSTSTGSSGAHRLAADGSASTPPPAAAQLGALGEVILNRTLTPAQERAAVNRFRVAGTRFLAVQLATAHSRDLSSLLTISILALAAMTIVSIGLGWLMAGRALRPLRTMTAAAQQISERNLHERLALDGPDDELHDLADTFDGLLGRLERAFEAQRRFVANASHELRTPLTVERAMIEVALADPDADLESLRSVCQRVLAAGEQQERLIEALLTLARSERGLERREVFDLADIVRETITALGTAFPERSPGIETDLGRAAIDGDRRLIERLVVNLVDNALRHNVPDGWVKIATGGEAGGAWLTIANSGPRITASEIPALLEPFRRAAPDRAGTRSGHGLGLSIAVAIAETHGAELSVQPGRDGGLEVAVRFPPRMPRS